MTDYRYRWSLIYEDAIAQGATPDKAAQIADAEIRDEMNEMSEHYREQQRERLN